ncbi:hypothetical protein L950_0213365 [Sphingobacterium sp. IITKGP-BTPF85]|jgi:hypothetical protein|nr:hypothetical protein L950_0213365 [Sphingobacterium sp. IITKGP-BTPF85]
MLGYYCYIIKLLNIKNIKITYIMGNLLYIIAVILVIIWAISFLGGFYSGGIIHALLVIAIIVVLLRVIRGNA